MILQHVYLSGSIGLKRGLGLSQVEISFKDIPRGIISLVGRNGSGKSTFMENLTPYRFFPSRGDKVTAGFVSPKSVKELYFEHQGSNYRCLFEIDGKQGNGNYYLYEGDSCLNDGSARSYDREVNKLLGSQDLFFKTTFLAQGSKKIGAWTKGERKGIFAELLNLSKMEEMSSLARQWKSTADTQLTLIRERLDEGRNELRKAQEVKQGLQKVREDIERNKKESEKVNQRVEKAKEALEDVRGEKQDQQLREKDLERFKLEKENLQKQIEKETKQFEKEEGQLKERLEETKKRAADFQNILDREDEITAGYEHLVDLQEKDSLGGKFDKKDAILKAVSETVEEVSKLRERHKALSNEIKRAKDLLQTTSKLPCEEELQRKCPLAEDMISQEQELPKKEEELQKLDIQIKRGQEREKKLETEKEELEEEIQEDQEEIAEHQKYVSLWENLKRAKDFRKDSGLDSLVHSLSEKKKEYTRSTKELKKEVGEKEGKIFDLQGSIDFQVAVRFQQAETNVSEAEQEMKRVEEERTSLLQEESAQAALLKGLDDLKDSLKKEKRKLGKTQMAFQHWNTLVRAFGKDGIQALEIDAAGPHVTDIANKLLKESFGELFTVAFRTTRRSKDGKKVLEDFGIDVWWKGVKTPIEKLSGGEKVWVQEAIREAIFIYQRSALNSQVKTAFLDESDGALDNQSRQDFFTMVDTMHQLSGLHHLFVVTQDPNLQTSIGSQLIFDNGRIKISI